MTDTFTYVRSRKFVSKLKRLLDKRKGKPEPLPETLSVVMYELGDLAKALTYIRFYPEFEVAYRGEAKAALADLIAQVELLVETLGLDWEELRELGDERFLNSDELDRRHAKYGTKSPQGPEGSTST